MARQLDGVPNRNKTFAERRIIHARALNWLKVHLLFPKFSPEKLGVIFPLPRAFLLIGYFMEKI
jgi:hypothetical protein